MKKSAVKIGIAGIGGYTGSVLYSILLNHPHGDIVWVSSEPSHVGKKIKYLFPHFMEKGEREIISLESALEMDVDVVFTALPHKIPMKYAEKIVKRGIKLIDLSADFRFKDPKKYEKWYGVAHSCPGLLEKSVYGLPEIFRDEIRNAEIIGNPGCYPTAAIIALYPLLKERIVEFPVIIDAKSGVSGAGRAPSEGNIYCEVNEGLKPYGIFTHRHAPEIEEVLKMADTSAEAVFIPHLVPMTRGIEETIYCRLRKEIEEDKIFSIYNEFYKDEPFVQIFESGTPPSTKYVLGTNKCILWMKKEEKNLVIVSCIDNLVKGASGQAVQNFNILFGFPEETSLTQLAIYP